MSLFHSLSPLVGTAMVPALPPFPDAPGAPRYPLPVGLQWAGAELQERERLALLCHETLGLLRLEVDVPYALHRAVASPRSLHPLDLILSLPGPWAGLPAGTFRYLPQEHVLAWLGAPPADANGPTLHVRAALGRIVPLYGRLALRLVALEAGAIAAQLSLLAEAMGLAPISTPRLPDLEAGDLATVTLTQTGRIAPDRLTELRRRTRQRNSGYEYRGFALADRPVSLDLLQRLCQIAQAGDERLELLLVARRVDGLPGGLYALNPDGSLDRRRTLQALPPGRLIPHSGIREESIPLQLFLVPRPGRLPDDAPLEALLALHLQAGMVGHRVALALDDGLACRPSLTFDQAVWDRLVGPERLPLLSLLIGWNRFRPYAYNLTL